MNCERIQELLPDYWMGALGERDRLGVESHLSACPACREDVAMWERLGALPDEQPSPALRARFEGMLTAYRAGTEHAVRARRFSFSEWLGSWWPRRPALQFALSAACLVLGLTAGLLLAPRGSGGGEIASLREEVHKTRQLVALSLLEQQSATDRLRGVGWSNRLENPDAEVLSALVETVKHDNSVDVRLAAIDALRRYTSLPIVEKGLREALRGPQSPLVQIALIDLVVETRDRRSVDLLKQLRSDQNANQAVRQRAEWGLQHF